MNYTSILLITIFTLNYNLSLAQSFYTETEKANKSICINFTKELISSFQLNENEYIKLKSLNIHYISKVAESNALAQITPSGLTNSLYELEKQHEYELLSFLSPNQLQAYKAYKETNKSVLRQLVEIIAETTGKKEMLATISSTH